MNDNKIHENVINISNRTETKTTKIPNFNNHRQNEQQKKEAAAAVVAKKTKVKPKMGAQLKTLRLDFQVIHRNQRRARTSERERKDNEKKETE